jgi:succinate dehydrogenase / fumarate reductase membrane anchor subunit
VLEGTAVINRIVVGAHYGLKDWIAQRATAVVMAFYSVFTAAIFLVLNPADFTAWRNIFANGPVKFFTFLFALSLFYHAWVGIRDLWMDYVKLASARLVLHVLTILTLIGYAAWAAAILWRL